MTASAADPIQAAVERWLRAVVTAPIVVPASVVKATGRCVARQARVARRLLAQPSRLVTSLVAGRAGPRDAPRPPDPVTAGWRPPADVAVAVEPTSVDPAALPIEEYESLAASQVVARLPSLTAGELDVVRRFEAGHRGRRTVLGKIDQLLARA